MGGPDINYPQKSPAEEEMTKQQLDMLTEQNRLLRESSERNKQMEPLFWEAIGVEPVKDEAGNITGFNKRAQTQAEKDQEEILGLTLSREKQALAGELPVDPALTRSLEENEQSLRQSMQGQLGPGWETSSPGIEALADFGKRKNELLDAARRGDISMYEGMSLMRADESERQLQNMLGRFSMVPGAPGTMGMTFGQASQSYNAPLAYGQAERYNRMVADYWERNSPTIYDKMDKYAVHATEGFKNVMQGLGPMMGGGCWIAAAIYGRQSIEFPLAWYWINVGWQGRLAGLVRRLYYRVGPRVAGWVRRWPLLGRLLRPLFNRAVWRGAAALGVIRG